jgi:hypothetical protein
MGIREFPQSSKRSPFGAGHFTPLSATEQPDTLLERLPATVLNQDDAACAGHVISFKIAWEITLDKVKKLM